MPRWDKFFEGAAQGIPQGYRMGLAYQEEQRAKAQDARAATKHEKDMRGMDQTYNYNEVMNPLLIASQTTANDEAGLRYENDKKFAATERQLGIDTDKFNLEKGKTEFTQAQNNLNATADVFNNLYGPAPAMGTWQKFLSSPAPKAPEQLALWKQGKIMMDNPGFKRAFAAIQQFENDKRAGLTPETLALREKALATALRAGGEQSFDVFEDVHKRAMGSGRPGVYNGVIAQSGVNLSGLTLRDGFLTNTEIGSSGEVTLYKVFPLYKDGKQVGFRKEPWKTYSAEDVQTGTMRRDLMSWGVDRQAPSQASAAAADAALTVKEREAEIARKLAAAAGKGGGTPDEDRATERMAELGDIAKNNPKLYQIFSELTQDEFSKLSTALDSMEGDTLTNMMTAIKAMKTGLVVVTKGGKYYLKNPQTGALVSPDTMPLQ